MVTTVLFTRLAVQQHSSLNAQILDDIADELATFVVNDKASGIKCLNDSNISHLMIFITLQRN